MTTTARCAQDDSVHLLLTPRSRRLMRDFMRIQKDPPPGISAVPNENNVLVWHAVVFGPEGTPWEGGTFRLRLEFSEAYPNEPPKAFFTTKVFHPNVYNNTGAICLDILQKNWSPAYEIAAILTSIQSLLSDPNTSSPANNEAAKLFEMDKAEYIRRVKETVEDSWEYQDEH